jgi:FecR protein
MLRPAKGYGAMYELRWALVLALILAVAPTMAVADSIGSATATKNEVEGVVGGSTQHISSGSSVYHNELVRTGASGVADLEFLDKTNLNVGPKSEIRLDKFVYDPAKSKGKVTLNASRGAFRFVTGVQDHKSYEIKTPYATLGVRGTAVEVVLENRVHQENECPPGTPEKDCKLPPACRNGYEQIRVAEGEVYGTTISGKRFSGKQGELFTVCSNGSFGQTQSSQSILNFTTAAAGEFPIAPIAAAAAAAAAAASAAIAATPSTPPCTGPSCHGGDQ